MRKIQKIKKTLFLGLIFIVISLFTITGIYAITNYFATQTRHEIKISNKYAPFFIIEDYPSYNIDIDKKLIPFNYPYCLSDQTHKITKGFKCYIKTNGGPTLPDMYLKIKLSYDTKNTFDTQIAEETFSSCVMIWEKGRGLQPYNDEQRARIYSEYTHEIKIETQQKDFLPDDITDPQLFVVVDYELVDKEGNSFASTRKIIQSQVKSSTNTMSNS